jgi:hypothetical protein
VLPLHLTVQIQVNISFNINCTENFFKQNSLNYKEKILHMILCFQDYCLESIRWTYWQEYISWARRIKTDEMFKVIHILNFKFGKLCLFTHIPHKCSPFLLLQLEISTSYPPDLNWIIRGWVWLWAI